LKHILASRSAGALKQWHCSSDLRAFALLSPLVREYGGWPNCLFIPEDECAALFWPYGSDSGVAELLSVPAKDYGVDDRILRRWESVSYGAYVRAIAESLQL
jgi:hypothetical protein